MPGSIRPPAVAGAWYPGAPDDLARHVDRYLAAADADASPEARLSTLTALIAPHAGLMYSGPVAAHAYRLLRNRPVELAVLVGPSHFIGFDGVAVSRAAGFGTPFGVVPIDQACAAALIEATPLVREHPSAHVREHSLEMQLPFLLRVSPEMKIVPLLVGFQTAEVARELGRALAEVIGGRNALLIASTDLSHYHEATVAARLDGVVIDHVARLDADGLQRALDARPDHACGGGPTVAVMRAARQLGARQAVISNYGDSGDVSGDKSSVVGYLAAALGVE
jgi:AmmeMemoRadiSam system protein B